MWLISLSLPLLPTIIIFVYFRYHVKVASLCRRALAWAQSLMRGRVCVKDVHAFVFTNCTHGKADSVLEMFHRYAETHHTLSVGQLTGDMLDEVIKRTHPLMVLELGTHCGYSTVRMLRLLPPGGRVITVETDSVTADLGEEIIMVAGFKHAQFQVLPCSSAEAISSLHSYLEADQSPSEGIDLVLMDHDPQQYLQDLLLLEREELLCPSGCTVLLIKRTRRDDECREILDYVRKEENCYSIRTEFPQMMEIVYRKDVQRREG
ncbi:transmembrane O-methyltransferase homolog isoform X2 [Gouania willdenowi]|uniref:transmembrane O-methyltransferase homolog isoform X2 n=1 Tax=Gouania willdenowi TaxID=441366 RepID=UPI001055C9A6|nr:transmembrane O-methyltransferase homolog isoform X2 [Gouania willdenowi]